MVFNYNSRFIFIFCWQTEAGRCSAWLNHNLVTAINFGFIWLLSANGLWVFSANQVDMNTCLKKNGQQKRVDNGRHTTTMQNGSLVYC